MKYVSSPSGADCYGRLVEMKKEGKLPADGSQPAPEDIVPDGVEVTAPLVAFIARKPLAGDA